MTAGRPRLKNLIRVSGGLALGLLILLSLVELSDFSWATLASSWTEIALVGPLAFFVLSIGALLAATTKWRLIWSIEHDAPPRFGFLLLIASTGNLLGQVLPKALGHVFVRAWAMRWSGLSLSRSVGYALFDKALDLVAILAAGPALMVIFAGGDPLWALATTFFSFLAVGGALVAGLPIFLTALRRLALWRRGEAAGTEIDRLAANIGRQRVIMLFGLSSARTVFLAARAGVLAWSLPVAVPAVAAGLLSVTALLAASLGLTPAGLGVMEGAWVVAATPLQINLADALAFLLSLRFLQIATVLALTILLTPFGAFALRRPAPPETDGP